MRELIHSLDPKIAELVGVNAALIFQKIVHYCAYHEAEGTNCHDGHYWSYNTHAGMAKQFEYFSSKQIRRGLEKLLENGLILKGNYNKFKNDRTLWYAISPDFHMPKKANANALAGKSTYAQKGKSTYAQKGTPLPITNNKIPDILCFDKFYDVYPPTKFATKSKASAFFERLSEAEQQKAIASAKVYARYVAKSDGKYVISPQKFLEEKMFRLKEYQPPKTVLAVEIPEEGTPEHKLYDVVVAHCGESVWVSWFGPDKIRIVDAVAIPSTKFIGSKIEQNYSSVLEAAGLTLGAVA